MKQHDYSNNMLSLLNTASTPESVCQNDQLNNSIDLYLDNKVSAVEVDIVKYLHGLGIQTKTDPELKEQKYWESRRIETNKKVEQFKSQSDLPLNSTLSKLLKFRHVQTFECLPRSTISISQLLDD